MRGCTSLAAQLCCPSRSALRLRDQRRPRAASARAGGLKKAAKPTTDAEWKGGYGADCGRSRGDPCRRAIRPIATSILATSDGSFTSTPDVQSLGTSVARRVDLTRSKLLSGTVGPGALLPYRLRQPRPGFRPFNSARNCRSPRPNRPQRRRSFGGPSRACYL